MFQVRAASTPARGSADRRWTLLLRGGAALLAVLVVAFGVLYWTDQRTPSSPSMNQRAIGIAEAAVRKAPNDVPARLALAGAYTTDRRYDDAVSQADQVLKVDAMNVSAFLSKGYALYLKGDLPGASAAYQKVVDNGPKGEFSQVDGLVQEAHYYLGAILVKQHEPADAIAELDLALRMNPTDADALYQRGLADAATGKTRDAVTDYSKALAFVPTGWPEPWVGLAAAYTTLKDQPRAAYATAMSHLATSKVEQARTELGALLDGPVAVQAMVGLGTLAQTQGDDGQALDWYEKALKADPGNAAATAAVADLKSTGMPSSAPSSK